MKSKVLIMIYLVFSVSLLKAEYLEVNFPGRKLNNKDILQCLKLMQPILDFHAKIYSKKMRNKYTIRLFEDLKKYKEFQKNHSPTHSNNGYYSGRSGEMVIFKNKRYLKTIIHEFQHAVFRSYVKSPKWLNEGLSEVFENIQKKNESFYVTVQNKRKKRVLQILNTDRYQLLRNYFSLSNKEWKKEKFSRTLAWAIVYYYFSSKDTKKALIQLIKNLKRNKLDFYTMIRTDREFLMKLGKNLYEFYTFGSPSKIKL